MVIPYGGPTAHSRGGASVVEKWQPQPTFNANYPALNVRLNSAARLCSSPRSGRWLCGGCTTNSGPFTANARPWRKRLQTMTIPPALPSVPMTSTRILLADLEADIATGRRELLTILAAMHNVDPPRQAVMQEHVSTLVADLARLDNMRRGCAANLDE